MNLSNLKKHLEKQFPDGYFLKPSNGFRSDGQFISEKSDFEETYQVYLKKHKPKLMKLLNSGYSLDDALSQMADIKSFWMGYTLDLFLNKPDMVLAQERLRLKKVYQGQVEDKPNTPIEVRVHFVEGKILEGASWSRHFRDVSPKLIYEAELVAEEIASYFDFPITCGMDLILTEGDGWKVIELNMGSSLGTLEPGDNFMASQKLSERYLKKPTRFLKSYYKIMKESNPYEKMRELESLLGSEELKPLKNQFGKINLLDVTILQNLMQSHSNDKKLRQQFMNLMDKYKINLTISKMDLKVNTCTTLFF